MTNIVWSPTQAARWRRGDRSRTIALSASAKVGLVLSALCIGVGVLGPFFAPHDPTELLGAPYTAPSSHYWLGLDSLGRDAFSRFLWGGRTAITLALLATLIGTVVGVITGILAAYVGGLVDAVFNRLTELLLAFPGLVLMLLVVSSFGSSRSLLVGAVAFAFSPKIARIIRGAALEIRKLSFVEVAEARGESRSYIVLREILPNILAPIGVDFGLRWTSSIVAIASLSFLGLGLQPPAADWGLIINENRAGMGLQPWPVVAPVVTIALLTVGINLVMDGVRRARTIRLPDRGLR